MENMQNKCEKLKEKKIKSTDDTEGMCLFLCIQLTKTFEEINSSRIWHCVKEIKVFST